jgi:hypothetical protein
MIEDLRELRNDRLITVVKEKKIDYRLIAWSLEWEGNISVNRNNLKSNICSYKLDVCIGNTDKELLEEFKSLINIGYIDNGCLPKENWSKIYKWYMSREEISIHLPLILPYLISKWRQAELVIEADKIIKTKDYSCGLNNQERSEMYTYEEVLTLYHIWRECEDLNNKNNIKNNEKDILYMHLRKY